MPRTQLPSSRMLATKRWNTSAFPPASPTTGRQPCTPHHLGAGMEVSGGRRPSPPSKPYLLDFFLQSVVLPNGSTRCGAAPTWFPRSWFVHEFRKGFRNLFFHLPSISRSGSMRHRAHIPGILIYSWISDWICIGTSLIFFAGYSGVYSFPLLCFLIVK
jgi:hypothetical protein